VTILYATVYVLCQLSTAKHDTGERDAGHLPGAPPATCATIYPAAINCMVGASKFLSKDGVDEWTALLAVIVEKYPNLRTTIVNTRKVCVDNNQKTRAH
jgi:hypothetical protein